MSVKIYSKNGCIFCDRAKTVLEGIKVEYEEIKLDPSHEKEYTQQRDRLIEETKHKTFPWVFVGERFIGGFNELKHSVNTLKLNEYLKEIGIEVEMDF